jgi:glycosyltransferase involved in cell wall biosynthesis
MAKILEKKRILVVCQHYWPESFRINDLTNFFREKNCEVDVLCGIPNYPEGKFYPGYGYLKNRRQVHRGVKIIRTFELPRGNNSSLRIFLNYLSFPLASLFHIPYLLGKKYDKIFIYQLSPVMMAIAGIFLGKLTRTETTMYVLDLWPQNLFSVLRLRNKFLRSLVTGISSWHYKKVDKLIVLSKKMEEQILRVTGKSKKTIIVPQCCEKIYEKNINDPKLTRRFKDTFNVVYAGNISPAQSFETILSASEIIKGKLGKKIRWIIVGDGMSRKAVEEVVKRRGLQDIFVFEGQKPVEEIPKYHFVADALLGTLAKSDLLEATIPAKVTSYLAAGKPVILSMDGEVRELIKREKLGFASETENPDALAVNIIKLYSLSPDERKKMGDRAKKYQRENFERNKNFEKIYNNPTDF